MTARIRYDQVGLAASTGPGAREDGLDNGALVTITNDSGLPCRVELTWVVPDDTAVAATLSQTGPSTWTFAPTAARYGSYEARMIEAEGTADETVDVKVFGIKLPVSGLLIPAFNEIGDPNVKLTSSTTEKTHAAEISSNNAPSPQGLRWLGWWRAIEALFWYVELSVGGGGGGGGGDVVISVAADHTITNADYGGEDPATKRLVVNVTAAATITFPSTPVAGQTVAIAKVGAGAFAVTIASSVQNIQRTLDPVVAGVSQVAAFVMAATTTLAFLGQWRFDGNNDWMAVTNPRDKASVPSTSMHLPANSIPARAVGTNGAGAALALSEGHVLRRLAGGVLTSGKVVDELCSFVSSDSKLVVDQVSSSAQATGSINNTNNANIAGPTNIADGEFIRITWTILVTFGSVDYFADCRITYKHLSEVLTVVEVMPISTPPPGLTLTGTVTAGNQPQLNILNGVGSTLNYYVHYSTFRQVK